LAEPDFLDPYKREVQELESFSKTESQECVQNFHVHLEEDVFFSLQQGTGKKRTPEGIKGVV